MANSQLQQENLLLNSEDLQGQKIVKSKSGKQGRGIAWVLGSFILCPCHLPVTLGLLTALFGGTALGTFFAQYSIIAGAIITLLWLAGTWYGFRLLRSKSSTTCAIR